MKKVFGRYTLLVILVLVLVIGQGLSFLLNPAGWSGYAGNLMNILGMIAFWGPIIAVIASLFVWIVMRLLGFTSLDSIRQESVEQNNPAPAIIFVGTLIASVLFLMLVIKT
jgi:hypothetical protein